MENVIGPIVLGILIIILGVSNMKGNISTIHSYHRKRVSEENKMPFARKIGLGTIIIGVGITVFGAISFFENEISTLLSTIILIISIVIGMGLSFYAMIKYNKGIF